MAQWVKYLTAVTQVTMKVGVSSPAWCSVLKDPALLQLWWRLQMWLRFQSLVQELPYAHVCGPKKKKKKKKSLSSDRLWQLYWVALKTKSEATLLQLFNEFT